jgi:hypothetical protein
MWVATLKALSSALLRPYCGVTQPTLEQVIRAYLSYRQEQDAKGDDMPNLRLILDDVMEERRLDLLEWCAVLEAAKGHAYGESLPVVMRNHVCSGAQEARYVQGGQWCVWGACTWCACMWCACGWAVWEVWMNTAPPRRPSLFVPDIAYPHSGQVTKNIIQRLVGCDGGGAETEALVGIVGFILQTLIAHSVGHPYSKSTGMAPA